MKKIIYLLVCASLFSIWSCSEDTINLDPIGATEADFYQNEAQMTEAVFGIYQKLGFFYHWRAQGYVHNVDLLPSDDIKRTGSGPFENFESLNGNTGRTNNVYRFSYELIARANTLLSKIEENGSFAYESEPELANTHKGEALFLRALTNFRLWNVYGTAPLVTERIAVLDDAFPPNSAGTELLDQTITDLTMAASLLPDNWDDSNLGRATKNSANGLLVKALVFRGTVSGNSADFTSALNAYNAIGGVSLTANYEDNFDAALENNSESLFELQADDNVIQTNGWLPGGVATDGFATNGELNAYYGFFTGSFEAGATFLATESLLNAYNPLDPRLALSFDPVNENPNIIKYITKDQLVEAGNPGNLSVNNPRILRYADVMLLAAEATVRSGGSLPDAIALVNQVRERARNSSETPSVEPADLAIPASSDEALELIFNERRLELAAEEGHRWYDLRRRHIAGEIDLTNWDFSSDDPTFNFQPFNIYFPLPENEVIQSPNLNQNEGY